MSAVVVKGRNVPDDIRRSMELWVGCVAGALLAEARIVDDAALQQIDSLHERIRSGAAAGAVGGRLLLIDVLCVRRRIND